MKKIYTLILAVSSLAATAQTTNTFPTTGNVGIGTTSPAAKLSFNEVNDGTNGPDGITWYNTAPLNYGIYRTPGPWTAPAYQQLRLQWDTGIILYPGYGHSKSFVDVQGDGLRVTSGNVGIGTEAPAAKLDVFVPASTFTNNIKFGDATPAYLASGNSGIYLSNNTGNQLFMIQHTGNVGIGTMTPNSKLAVNGNIRAHEIKVETANWPDYVFAKDYELPTLQETEKHIKDKGHLPGIPSAAEVKANGVDLGEMNAKLLQKIEELTLHLIEQNKKFEAKISAQQQEIDLLKRNRK
ncbi:hypothetical protein [Pedobacter africanus]|uniref:Cell wall surface anchor family protein n=1 Tax=Pedobacter africanus TaxID=151894 RepID=A0A1W2BP57_9SPHI|nr:hypothetical protein [Pedobacter africanus]SMC74749.1 hypothetical protein SAMN04488524_2532 [Pedobacter africanus]